MALCLWRTYCTASQPSRIWSFATCLHRFGYWSWSDIGDCMYYNRWQINQLNWCELFCWSCIFVHQHASCVTFCLFQLSECIYMFIYILSIQLFCLLCCLPKCKLTRFGSCVIAFLNVYTIFKWHLTLDHWCLNLFFFI